MPGAKAHCFDALNVAAEAATHKDYLTCRLRLGRCRIWKVRAETGNVLLRLLKPGYGIRCRLRSEFYGASRGARRTCFARSARSLLVEGNPPLWKIVAANDAALQEGIQFGMGGSQAAQFNQVVVRQRSSAQEKIAHAALLDVGWSLSPRIEDTAPDMMIRGPGGPGLFI